MFPLSCVATALPKGFTVSAKTNRLLSIYFRVTTNYTGQNVTLFIHLANNGDMKADKNAARQP